MILPLLTWFSRISYHHPNSMLQPDRKWAVPQMYCYNIMMYNKNIYIWSLSLFLVQGSYNPWNCLNVKRVKDVFCYINEVTFGKHLRKGAVSQGHQPWNWTVGTFSSTSRDGRGVEVESLTNGGWFNLSFLCSEAFIKTQKDQLQRASQTVNTETLSAESVEAPGPFPIPRPMHLFHLTVPEL